MRRSNRKRRWRNPHCRKSHSKIPLRQTNLIAIRTAESCQASDSCQASVTHRAFAKTETGSMESVTRPVRNSAESTAKASYPATKKVAALGDQAWSMVCFVREARYPRRSFRGQSPEWQQTRETESVFSQKSSRSQCGSIGPACCKRPATKPAEKLNSRASVASARVSRGTQEQSHPAVREVSGWSTWKPVRRGSLLWPSSLVQTETSRAFPAHLRKIFPKQRAATGVAALMSCFRFTETPGKLVPSTAMA